MTCTAQTSTASPTRHARPWGSDPEDHRLDELALGSGTTPSDVQRSAARRLPDWLRRTQGFMHEARRGGLALEHGTSIPKEEVQDLRRLFEFLPSGLLLSRFRETAQEFRELRELDGDTICSFDQLYQLLDLMAHVRSALDRVMPGGGRFQPEVLQALAGLRRWERSDHPSLPAEVRQDIADQLMQAAVTDPELDAQPTVLEGWRDGLLLDLPDAHLLRQLHLPAGLVQMKLEDQLPLDWSDLRCKADAGGITLIR
ncbi:hypothetical protein [Mitsuaria sp. 7]|uniref:hypothetical protein n=1 Tax=Mitsuaria sp. 7 TaxID=1658665 RepID=UPI0007DD628B|nr:hypothetical protein [Mitsuaria sp. 7]ANH68499.1 hypothetical protein ABE85_14650 [Mitsuaria sp. 7]